MFKRLFASTIVVLSLSAAIQESAQAQTVRIYGSTVVSEILIAKERDLESSTGLDLDIVRSGSTRGVADLLEGSCEIAITSAPLVEIVDRMNRYLPGSVDPAKLMEHRVGTSQISFIVHPSNPVKQLTLAQVTDILAGRVTNWSDVGGPDQPIDIAVTHKGEGTRTIVEQHLLDGSSIPGSSRELKFASQVAKVVAAVPTAFGVTSIGNVSSDVVAVSTDNQIIQPLFMVTLGQPAEPLARVITAAKGLSSE